VLRMNDTSADSAGLAALAAKPGKQQAVAETDAQIGGGAGLDPQQATARAPTA